MAAALKSRSAILERIAALACATLTTAFVAGVVALLALQLGLPPSDSAHDAGLLVLIADPFVARIWIAAVLASAVIGFAFAVPLLWYVSLPKAVPWVAGITIIAAGVGALASPAVGPVVGLVAGLIAMLWARSKAEWRT